MAGLPQRSLEALDFDIAVAYAGVDAENKALKGNKETNVENLPSRTF